MSRQQTSVTSVITAMVLACIPVSAWAGVVGSWDFDAQALTPTQGDGSQVLIGGTTATGAIWVSGQTNSSYTSWGYETDSYPTQGTADRTAGIRFSVSTGGYTGITVSFGKLHGGTASRYVRFQFSTDGGSNWSDAASGSLMQETSTQWTAWSFDLSSFPGVNNNPNFRFRMVAEFDPAGSPGSYAATSDGSTYSQQGAIAWDNVVVTGTRTPLANFIEDVPDVNQPCANPLGVSGFIDTNYCAPMSAFNIIDYWDVVASSAYAADVDGNPNPGPTSVAQFIGWWMNTNDDPAMNGCPYRINGNPTSKAGSILDDVPPGIVQYVRWDSSHDFGCSPPSLLVGKKGYDWTVGAVRSGTMGWVTLQSEIDNGRPLIASWEYWNPTNGYYNAADGITYYDWGAFTSGSTDPNHEENWSASEDIGHATTAVGYRQSYDPRGGSNPQDWVVVHDNWYSTARDVAIPWLYWDQMSQQYKTRCAALVTIDPASSPTVGSLTGAPGAANPPNKNAVIGSAAVAAQLCFTASTTENVLIYALKLQAFGSGNDNNEVTAIHIVRDNDNDGIPDTTKGDTILATHSGGYPSDNGTLTVVIPGTWRGLVKSGTTVNLLVVYQFRATAGLNKTFGFNLLQVYATGDSTHLNVPVNDAANPTNPFSFTSSTITTCDIPVVPIDGNDRWKKLPDGCTLIASNLPLLVIFNAEHRFYVEEQDRSSGLWLRFAGMPPPPASLGDGLFFEGRLQTLDGERYLLVTSPPSIAQGWRERPLGMPTRSVGGGDDEWEEVTGAGQKGVVGGVGLNNVGLLVRTWGRYMQIGPTEFFVDGGGGGGGAMPLKCVVPPDVTLEPWWSEVTVTGVSSTEMVGEHLYPVIRVRTQDDIRTP